MIQRLAVRVTLISLVASLGSARCVAQIVFSDEARYGGRKHSASWAGYVAPSDDAMAVDEVMGESGTLWEDDSAACFTDGSPPCVGSRLFVDAWIDQGVTLNTKSPANRFNTPVTFNDRSNDYEMNQLYFSLGRRVREDLFAWDLGAQVDVLYGTDYFYTTALGLETETDGTQRWNSDTGPRGAAMYGLAMPQLYAEVFAPLFNGVTVKMGHFYTPLGYETVTAPHNFFYSHSYTFQYGEPKTHTGLLADFDLGPRLSLQAGFTRGWDSWEDNNGEEAFLGGLRWTSWNEQTSLDFAISAGNEDPAGQNNRTLYSLVMTHHVSPCLTYVFQNDFGTEENAAINRNSELTTAKWYGINQYLYLALNQETSVGLRVEWFRDQNNARVLGIPLESDVMGGNYTEVTFGVNWNPLPFVRFRPELRWDWSDVQAPGLGLDGMFNDFMDSDQMTLGFDLIVLL